MEVDDIVRELGLPTYTYQLPASGRWILVYSADRVHKGTVAAAVVSLLAEGAANYGAGREGRQPTPHTEVEIRHVSCLFELEFDESLHLAAAHERGDGC